MDANIPFKIPYEQTDLMGKLNFLIEEGLSNDKNLTVKFLAEKLSISQSTLERIVKKKENLSPNQYILKFKLEKADLLLRTKPHLSIKELSFSMGFSSVSYFCKTYKQHFKIRPTDLKRKIFNQNSDKLTFNENPE